MNPRENARGESQRLTHDFLINIMGLQNFQKKMYKGKSFFSN